jgi:PBSX family phage terminase large subunit
MTIDESPFLWERQSGEPATWFSRFSVYRELGIGRSILAAYQMDCEALGETPKGAPPKPWWNAADKWQWKSRAQGWDKWRLEQQKAAYARPWQDKVMGETEAIGRMSAIGRNDLAPFFKVGERWTEYPLPTDEIIDERQTVKIINKKPIPVTEYLVKKIVLNMEALLDPLLSFRVREFTDSPKNGIGIKLHDPMRAIENMGNRYSAFEQGEQENDDDVQIFITIPANLIAPAFLDPFRDILTHRHTEYVFRGGRASTKSSFVSLIIILLLVNNPSFHALALRQVADTLRDSVYAQLVWAINELGNYYPGLSEKFHCTKTPLEITYMPTGQRIYFRGADDPGKIKSIKPPFGAISLLWFEECSEFHGSEAIRNITQSAIRGTDTALIFKTYNPPRTSGNWINKYILIPKVSQYQHNSDYRTVPVEWLGQVFLDEAEHLRQVNPAAYDHEYLGEVNGLGDQVFENLQLRAITDDEIKQFDPVCHGLDFGYFPDPAHYSRCHYDAARMTLYIYGEVRRWKTSNQDMHAALVAYGLQPDDLLIADSEDPKSIADYQSYGAAARGAEKGPQSVKYSIKWLQSLKAIVIDPERCPYTAIEFTDYAYERTKDGEIIEAYPDANNHAIDSVRYATNLIWRKRGQ